MLSWRSSLRVAPEGVFADPLAAPGAEAVEEEEDFKVESAMCKTERNH